MYRYGVNKQVPGRVREREYVINVLITIEKDAVQ